MGDPIVLPLGARLVHIGPHKTGTTAVQRAMHTSREALHEQGVHYAYPTVQAYKPAIGLTGLPGRRGGPVAGPADWTALVDEVRAAGDLRVVVSSESLANADTRHIEQLRNDLGPDRVHVVRMVRRYDKLIPSQWQQHLLNGRRLSLQGFCDRLLEPDSSFWQRHGFATLTGRWAEVVGVENVSVVVVDESNPRWLLEVFERMLSLREGTLPLPPGRPNRSLSLAEAETLRRINGAIARAGWNDRVIHHYVREGVSAGFKRIPADTEAGTARVPRALHEALRVATARDVEALLSLGVHVVGDVGLLDVPAWEEVEEARGPDRPVTLGVDSVASAVLAVIGMAEQPVPLGGVLADRSGPARSREPGRRLLRRRVAHLTPDGPAGEFARRAGGPAALDDPARASRAVLTVVPPWQLLAGRWQDHLADGGESEYADWLAGHPEAWDLPGVLVGALDRALERSGSRHVTVVVGDARLPDRWSESVGSLLPGRLPQVERSLLTWPEAEWLRVVNRRCREGGLDPERRRRHVTDGALRWALAHRPASDPGAHPLEGGQRDRADELGRALRAAIERAGVEVRGDLDGLTAIRPAESPARLAPRVAAWPIVGAIASSDERG